MTRQHEDRDVDVRRVYLFGLALFVLAVAVHAGLWAYDRWLDRSFSRRASEREARLDRPLPLEPRLQVDPGGDLARTRAAEEAALGTYAWEDRANGVVRIPVERAIELLAERGLPARGAPANGEGAS